MEEYYGHTDAKFVSNIGEDNEISPTNLEGLMEESQSESQEIKFPFFIKESAISATVSLGIDIKKISQTKC